MPVYRPLIAFDKKDIVEIAEKIDTLRPQFSHLRLLHHLCGEASGNQTEHQGDQKSKKS
jgi:adenylyl- and sulfurtransferase ThiI